MRRNIVLQRQPPARHSRSETGDILGRSRRRRRSGAETSAYDRIFPNCSDAAAHAFSRVIALPAVPAMLPGEDHTPGYPQLTAGPLRPAVPGTLRKHRCQPCGGKWRSPSEIRPITPAFRRPAAGNPLSDQGFSARLFPGSRVIVRKPHQGPEYSPVRSDRHMLTRLARPPPARVVSPQPSRRASNPRIMWERREQSRRRAQRS